MARIGTNNNCLFGPVRSRRLGHSLGIDLIKFKTCTFNCVFCECGKTTNLSGQRAVYMPTAQVLSELAEFYAHHEAPQVLTFSGGGEPTLAANIGEVIRELKKLYPQKLCLLTNSSLLSDPAVRQEILPVDIIIPSLNAVSPEIFNKINRPLAGIRPAAIMTGLLELRKIYTGQLFLEIFIVPGLNDTLAELTLLKDFVGKLQPDGIQLNSLDRPGVEDWVAPVTPEKMSELKDFFKEFKTNCYLAR